MCIFAFLIRSAWFGLFSLVVLPTIVHNILLQYPQGPAPDQLFGSAGHIDCGCTFLASGPDIVSYSNPTPASSYPFFPELHTLSYYNPAPTCPYRPSPEVHLDETVAPEREVCDPTDVESATRGQSVAEKLETAQTKWWMTLLRTIKRVVHFVSNRINKTLNGDTRAARIMRGELAQRRLEEVVESSVLKRDTLAFKIMRGELAQRRREQRLAEGVESGSTKTIW